MSAFFSAMSGNSQQELSDTANAAQNPGLIGGHDAENQYENATVLSESESDDVLDSDNEDWEVNSDFGGLPSKTEAETRQMLRRDIRIAKEAGYRVGCLGSLDGVFVVSLACRISRLGITEDVMQAWSIKPSEYIVLLIQYPSSYRSFGEILQVGDKQRLAIQLHVGLCDSYKPSFEHAHKIFKAQDVMEAGEAGCQLRPLFIDSTLNGLLNDRFFAIVKSRWQFGLSWKGAELFTHYNQGRSSDCGIDLGEEYFKPDVYGEAGPAFLTFDHMDECNGDASQISYPLLAMQFTLRHFVYCTKFCLVCYCRLEFGYESLKPYVCSNALCLYQYMSLGMGTALEHEIRSEPFVVDLLISFTYSRAVNFQLDDFPSGLQLMVPGMFRRGSSVGTLPGQGDYPRGMLNVTSMVIQFDTAHPFKVGDWVVLNEQTDKGPKVRCWHCRVESLGSPVTLQLCRPLNGEPMCIQGETKLRGPLPIEVQVIPYNRNFDELELNEKRHMLPDILDTLPSVDEMIAFLGTGPTKRELSSWKERISTAALGILRWIIASNRSYIKLDHPRNSQDKVTGMYDFIQFRLVQGAPNKEHEFTNAVFKHGQRTSSLYPTIFAWHGSPLHNWHSILREGLHFEYTANGRSYGDGVYFSSSFQKAKSYTSRNPGQMWRNSKLNIRQVMSLNEIVNDTENFVHSGAYLVVNRLNWIQPRFLFVKSKTNPFDTPDSVPAATPAPITPYEQDPSHLVTGPDDTRIQIPASAFGHRRWECGRYGIRGRPTINLSRKRKQDAAPVMTDDEDGASIETDSDDLEVLLSDTESDTLMDSTPRTGDFIPGTLTEDSLPLIDVPTYATRETTDLLQQHLQATLKVQEEKSPQTLGWYMNRNVLSTVYQWIVELHSFDQDLPLAQDLKKANMQSVVLELRFSPGFPTAPPFVRVIRPQFLEFGAGGGGPVTTGGAFCLKLLTNSGWVPSVSIESVLGQVRTALSCPDPRPARVARASRQRDYSFQEAVDFFRRECRAHGWLPHKDIDYILSE